MQINPIQSNKTLVYKKTTGFSLMEVVITMAIVGILTSLALPSFTTLIQNNRIIVPFNEYNFALKRARDEARMSSTIVIVCASSNISIGNPTCDQNTTAWNSGFLVYAKPFNSTNNTVTPYNSATDTLIQSGEFNFAGTINSDAVFIAFNREGLSLPIGSTNQLRVCDSRGQTAGLTIAVSPSGKSAKGDTTLTGC